MGVGLLCIDILFVQEKGNLKSQLRVTRVWANIAYSFIVVSNVAVYFVQMSYK